LPTTETVLISAITSGHYSVAVMPQCTLDTLLRPLSIVLM